MKTIRRQKITDIKPAFCTELGIRTLLLDIDNTLAVHGSQVPYPGVVQWVEQMKQNGFCLAVISNNDCDRVSEFAGKLGLPYVYKAKKPLPSGLRKALRLTQTKKKEAVLVGDQLFTDQLGAKLFGMKFILLEPIEDEKTRFLLCKRKIDRFIRKILYGR